MLRFVLLLAAAGWLADAACLTNTSYPGYLPAAVVPTHYDLNLTLPFPNVTATTFTGGVSIHLNILMSTSCIIVNSKLLTFVERDVVLLREGAAEAPMSVVIDSVTERATLHFPRDLPTGAAELRIKYSGTINPDNDAGLFLSDNTYNTSASAEELSAAFELYKSHASADDRAALREAFRAPSRRCTVDSEYCSFGTQLEMSDARRLFPCFDEPWFKATYASAITVPAGRSLTVLFNTHEVSRSTTGGLVTFTFAHTMHPQSSYLVALAVGFLDYVEQISHGTTFRIWTPPGKSTWAHWSMNVTTKIVEYFDRQFRLPYREMRTKMDQIALPNLYANAMENWGLITYWPPFLLVEPGQNDINILSLVAQVVTHEIAHQWYGNTVTCSYWGATYLQEGFARYLQYLAVDYLHPEWDVFNTPTDTLFGDASFFGWSYGPSMMADYKGVSPAVIVPLAVQPSGTMFYEKGASVNRMLASAVGLPAFWESLALELRFHRWQNPSQYDMMAAINNATKWDVGSRFLPWLMQPGFPVVRFSHSPMNGVLRAQQVPVSPFLPVGNVPWWISGNVMAKSMTSGKITNFALNFTEKDSSHTLAFTGDAVVLGNNDYLSFFIAAYDDSLWARAEYEAASPSFGEPARSLFIMQNGILAHMAHDSFLRFVGYTEMMCATLATGNYPVPAAIKTFKQMFGWIGTIASVLRPLSGYDGEFGSILAEGLKPLVVRVRGFYTGTPDGMGDLRKAVLEAGVLVRSVDVVRDALAAFQNPSLPSDVLKAARMGAVMSGEASAYNKVLNSYQNAKPEDKKDLLEALSLTPTVAMCASTINLIPMSPMSDFLKSLVYMASNNAICRSAAWTRFQAVAHDYWRSSGTSATNDMIAMMASFVSPAESDAARDLLRANYQYFSPDQLTRVGVLLGINTNLYNRNDHS